MKNHSDVFGCIGIGFVFILISTVEVIINGWALSALWGWFVVPIFNLPSLTIIQAIGIGLILSYITNKSPSQEDNRKTSEKIIDGIARSIMAPIFSVGTGWVIFQIM